MTPEQLVKRLVSSRARLAALATDLLSADEIALLLQSPVPATPRDMTPTDIALLDEARWLIDPDFRSFGHVIVDEAQNLTAMELRMAVRRARGQSLTILGDIMQRTADAGVSRWASLLTEAGVREHVVRDLRYSYRVPGDFLRLAAGVLPEPARIPTGVRTAPWPAIATQAPVSDLGVVTRVLAGRMADDAGSVGVVVPARRMADVRAGLAAVPHADARRDELGAGINLVDLQLVKGLEFDAVIVVEPTLILEERPDGGAGGLYTALTRSTRALAIVHSTALPDELGGAQDLEVVDGDDPASAWASRRRVTADAPA
jgi:hypothetical protein